MQLDCKLFSQRFLRSNNKKVRYCNTRFDRELQNCEKSLRKSKIVKMQCRGLFLMKVRCFIVYQDYSLFSEGFFQPAEIHRQQRKHRYNAKYTEDQRFFKGTGSNAAQNQRNIPYIMRKIPPEKQSAFYQQSDYKRRISTQQYGKKFQSASFIAKRRPFKS